jgi:hypothetical protein
MSVNVHTQSGYTNLILDRNRTACSHCKESKSVGSAFCRNCLNRLPIELQITLAGSLNEAYAEAKAAASEYLKGL